MKISGAIFDLDGTLTDSMYVWDDLGGKVARACGIVPEDTFENKIKNMSMRQFANFLTKEYGNTKTFDEIVRDVSLMIEPLYRDEVLAKDGIIQVLDELQRRGVKMCVATLTDEKLVELVLTRLDMRKYFSAIFTATGVGAGKDNPLIYETALSHLGTAKAETLVFEDAQFAAKTAKTAGFPVVGIYDSFSEMHQTELKKVSDIYIRDYRQDFSLIFGE